MLLDPDLEKIAVKKQQDLISEFAEKHTTLEERARRLPVSAAEEIANIFNCPLQIATIAYILDMDGITSTKNAVTLLSSELHRRAAIGDGVPNLPGNVHDFAVEEGRWIHYVYGSFTREFEIKIRELANLESVVDEDELPVEKAISLLNSRIKVAETFLLPVVNTWFKDHDQGTSEDLLFFLGPSITKWNRNTLRGKINRMKSRTQALLRRLVKIISDASDSMTMDAYSGRINTLIEDLDKDLNNITPKALSHLILHMAPRPTGARGDRSRFVQFGTASTRGNKAEPDMASPFDFLERDIRLAKRRRVEERSEYLIERISRVIKVLKFKGNDSPTCLEQCIKEIVDRFEIRGLEVGARIETMKDTYTSIPIEDYDLQTGKLVYSFVDEQILKE